jgi:deoxyribodipyrimidine photo-lyase
VPVWIASNKREVGARTLRPRIHKVFARYCTRFPDFDGNAHVKGGSSGVEGSVEHDWEGYETYLNLDASVKKVDGVRGGRDAAMERFVEFCNSKQHGLRNFDTLRNDPNQPNVCSNLSPWINAGHVSFQRLALDVRAMKSHPNGTASYIEEGVVRRELSDNFVFYSPDVYDSLDAAAGWARESLDLHSTDARESVYTWRELEAAVTHDDLWNAAQLQLVREGKMHGFVSASVVVVVVVGSRFSCFRRASTPSLRNSQFIDRPRPYYVSVYS